MSTRRSNGAPKINSERETGVNRADKESSSGETDESDGEESEEEEVSEKKSEEQKIENTDVFFS